MPATITASRLANLGANVINRGFDRYHKRFCDITDRAKGRFEQRDWQAGQRDIAERLDLYSSVVDRVEHEVVGLLGESTTDKFVWAGIKAVYSGLIAERDDWELAETFFNSVTRRIFHTVGVDPLVEFVSTDFAKPPTKPHRKVFQHYERAGSTTALLEAVLTDFRFTTLYQDIRRDARLAAIELERHLRDLDLLEATDRAEIVKAIFYRGKGAYIVGRMWAGLTVIPLVLALRNTDDGVVVDAVLTDEDDVSILFSFTRSYFHVEANRPHDLVEFLHTLMPRKRRAELYNAIGYNKHGKTELYRDLLDHLSTSKARFERAPGDAGLVMSVFTMPGFEMVFKVMRDVFGAPKQVTRGAVRRKYRLVFRHDRAGRLIEANEFEHLEFEPDRFDPDVLDELLGECSRTVSADDGRIVISHVYVERRVAPLNVYIREVDEEAARSAIIDHGNTIRDLAVSNIFPGDMLLKNFGVTRHGRVVFYDYDELSRLLDCTFKWLPPADTLEDEMAAEPWFGVGDQDIFPEELRNFLGLKSPLREVFLDKHGDLFDPAWWRAVQDRLRAGEIIEIFPYDERRRLAH
jgi:isocitrate dehydrogenase kinase/phosphatase